MPTRRAARKMVSPARISTSRSSRMKVFGLSVSEVIVAFFRSAEDVATSLSSPAPERLAELLGEILQHAEQRVGCRLAQPADRGVAHRVRQLGQQRFVPRT